MYPASSAPAWTRAFVALTLAIAVVGTVVQFALSFADGRSPLLALAGGLVGTLFLFLLVRPIWRHPGAFWCWFVLQLVAILGGLVAIVLASTSSRSLGTHVVSATEGLVTGAIGMARSTREWVTRVQVTEPR